MNCWRNVPTNVSSDYRIELAEHSRHLANRIVARRVQCLHDIRVVRASQKLEHKPWWAAALVSWGIALFEYLFQAPANRIGSEEFSLAQLKILQEVITLTVFVPFVIFYMHQPLKLDYLWAGLCILGAVYFIFRSG